MDITNIDVHAPAQQVAATLARVQLEYSLSAAARLHDGDPESLHDVRVSIKRLRTLLTAYRDDLGKSIHQPRKALGKLMDASNPGRDAEVQRDWLLAQDEGDIDLSARAGREVVLEHLTSQLNSDNVLDREHQQRQLAKIATKLEPILRKKQQKTPKRAPSFAAVTRQYLHDTHNQLQTDLQVLSQPDATQQQEALHHARLSGKRLRYLIEPLSECDASQALVEQLKNLQDALGHIHDMYVLEQTLQQQLEQNAITWAENLLTTDKNPRPVLCYNLAALTRYVHGHLHTSVRDLQTLWQDEQYSLQAGVKKLEQDLAEIVNA